MEKQQATLNKSETTYCEARAAREQIEADETAAMVRFASDMSETNRKAVEKLEAQAADARRIEKACAMRRDQALAEVNEATKDLKDARLFELRKLTSVGAILEHCEEEIRDLLALDERARSIIKLLRSKVDARRALRAELFDLATRHAGESPQVVARNNPEVWLNDVANAVCLLVTAHREATGTSKEKLESFVYTSHAEDIRNVNIDSIKPFIAKVLGSKKAS